MVAEMQRMPNEMNSLWRVYVSDDNGQAPSLNHGTCNKCIWWIGSALLASSLMMLLKFDSTNFRKNWSAPDSRHPLDWDLPCKSRLVKNVRKVWNPLTSTTHLTSSPIRIYTILKQRLLECCTRIQVSKQALLNFFCCHFYSILPGSPRYQSIFRPAAVHRLSIRHSEPASISSALFLKAKSLVGGFHTKKFE